MTTAVILAGGLGTRLRNVVADRPKPMALINGKPFLAYLLTYWASQGITRFIISIGYLGDIIKNHFGQSFNGIPIDYVVEASPLGTGGALILCRKALPDNTPFILLNGDTYFEVGLRALTELGKKKNADCVFSLFQTIEKERFMPLKVSTNGIVTLSSEINKNIEKPGDKIWANGGVYWVNSQVLGLPLELGKLVLSLEYDLLPYFAKLGKRLYGIKFEGVFIDIGIPDDYYRSQNMQCFDNKIIN